MTRRPPARFRSRVRDAAALRLSTFRVCARTCVSFFLCLFYLRIQRGEEGEGAGRARDGGDGRF